MIQDAILEKCIENGAGVVHIAVDKSSVEVKESNKLAKCPQNRKQGLLIVQESREPVFICERVLDQSHHSVGFVFHVTCSNSGVRSQNFLRLQMTLSLMLVNFSGMCLCQM